MVRVVVVGGGVAGLTFARTLSQRINGVVVLESGDRVRGNEPRSWNDRQYTYRDSRVVHTTARGPEWYPRGRGVGGGSLINGRLAMAGRPDDWDAWPVQFAMTDWSWETVEPFMRSVNTQIVTESAMGPTARAIASSSRDVGYRILPTTLFTAPVASDDCGEVRLNAHVEDLVVDVDRVVGVRLVTGELIEADHVVLAAGALVSPLLAMRSGVVKSNALIGLKDHPAIGFGLPTGASETFRGVGVVGEQGDKQIISVHESDRVTIIGAALRVHSRGVIERVGNHFTTTTAMLDDDRDVALLSDCLTDLIAVVSSLGDSDESAIVCGTQETPLRELQVMDASERVDWMRRNVSGNWHAACSMPMGNGAAVDQNGKVVGSQNLWCCDASVLCDLPRSPIQLPVMAVAATIAEHLALSLSPN